jgi:AraC-like DNA-binding protein
VRSRLLAEPGTIPSMAQIARELNVTTRTLHRHLAAEGVSFRTLIDEVRETLATELLTGTGLSVEQVARRLGYAEPASFTHAFIRWHGVAPGRYRRTH